MNEAYKACRSISKIVGYDGNDFIFYTTIKGVTFVCHGRSVFVFTDKYYISLMISEWIPSIEMGFYYRCDGTRIARNMDHLMDQIIETLPIVPEMFMENFSVEHYRWDESSINIINRLKLY